ncbi:hypothetical protein C7212DRAFT_366390 [Tuber magnatum]|uniref:Uncharacterized protein n=1 Tax=Tuber magnatum TaxID=42249 RepID=A0A317SEG6_9PEZI|nr:hypothetical protein C7212DRAFT_366390 [Tuber magnatum]
MHADSQVSLDRPKHIQRSILTPITLLSQTCERSTESDSELLTSRHGVVLATPGFRGVSPPASSCQSHSNPDRQIRGENDPGRPSSHSDTSASLNSAMATYSAESSPRMALQSDMENHGFAEALGEGSHAQYEEGKEGKEPSGSTHAEPKELETIKSSKSGTEGAESGKGIGEIEDTQAGTENRPGSDTKTEVVGDCGSQ